MGIAGGQRHRMDGRDTDRIVWWGGAGASMVETATFRIFHRAPATPEPDAATALFPAPGMDQPPPSAPLPNPDDSAPRPRPNDARARRQAARSLFHQTKPWPPASPGLDGAPLDPAATADSTREPADGLWYTPPALEAAPPGHSAPPGRPVYSVSLALEHQFLGLASPAAFSVTGTLGDSAPVRLSIGRTGLYGPDDVHPARLRGFAYETSPDRWTGLAAGTRILTARGEVPVEHLVPGDKALTLRGPALLPILWIGRSISADPPVKIDAGAFGPDRPRCPLYVGVEHALFLETMPVTARELVNGYTIRTLSHGSAELFHIDVGVAEVLLAEGVPLASGRR